MKIKTLHIVGSMNRGGAETFLMNVLRNVNTDKFEFIFLCYGEGESDYEKEILSHGAKIVRIPDVKDSGIRKHIQHLRNVIIDNQINVVHAHTYYNSLFSLIAAKLQGVRLRIIHSHSTRSEPNPSITKRIYFLVSKIGIDLFANKFVACGEDAGRALFMPWRKFSIINNGISIENFAYNEENRKNVRNELGIEQNATILMHAGRFAAVKNHTFLIDMFAEYIKLDASARLILVGVGPLRNEINSKVKQSSLADNVHFLDLRSDVNRIFSAADMFIFPSLFEGLPVVLVEAQANGLKCIISDTIDKNIKLTNCIKFYPLSKSPKAWAERIAEVDSTRINVIQDLLGGDYDMSANIENIEKIYNEA